MVRLRAVLLVAIIPFLGIGITLGLFACRGKGDSSPPSTPTARSNSDAAGDESAQSAAARETMTAPSPFPLRMEAGKRYLVDTSGNPFPLHGDTAWLLICEVSQADAEFYLEDRRQRGFNTILVSLIESHFCSNSPNNYYNVPPFTVPGDYSTPNEAYFAHADWLIQKAAEKGILVLLVPSYLGYKGGEQGWYKKMVANGETKMRTYGRYLGHRYAGSSNILWVHGGDYDPPNKALVREIALGIREFDARSLHTVHNERGTVVLDFWDVTTETWLEINSVYTGGAVYLPTLMEYSRPGQMPVFFIEGRYENEKMPEGSEQRVRVEAYQALLSGAMGHLFGNNPVWHFSGRGAYPSVPSDWKLWLNSSGAQSMTHLHSLLFASRAWWRLEPDATNVVLTGGLGSGLDRAVAARASDGSFVIAYLPSLRPITIDLTKLAGPNLNAQWYDPANGTYSPIAGSPFAASRSGFFTPPSKNASGFGDWVLVLESAP
jgi:hypothetical protein